MFAKMFSDLVALDLDPLVSLSAPPSERLDHYSKLYKCNCSSMILTNLL